MKTEKHLFNYAKKLAKLHGVGCYKVHCESKAGFPDLMLIYKSEIIFVELKSPSGTGRLSEIQKVRIKELKNHGAEVYVIDSAEVLTNVVHELINYRAA